MNVWNQIKEKLFPPKDTKWLAWLAVPWIFIALSGAVIIAENHILEVISIFLASLVLIFYIITANKGLFLLSFLSFMVVETYLFWHNWNVPWIGALLISLFLGYEIITESKKIFSSKQIVEDELKRDVDLWKARFETLREKLDSDKEVLEAEISTHENAVIEKNKEMDRLRTLISISHKETKSLEDEVARLKEALDSQKEALIQRQSINKSLQTKKSDTQPISLKDLIKKN